MKITVYADNAVDADRAFRVGIQDFASNPTSIRPKVRDCAVWSALTPGDDWSAVVWGTADNIKVDCRDRGNPYVRKD